MFDSIDVVVSITGGVKVIDGPNAVDEEGGTIVLFDIGFEHGMKISQP
ncbi:protein of unknown function [Candidatus Nitrosotalea okcheonensis]|uniref:Uncharacterized protein n=1 Tax=Candidatus Nitrosotalea okcheonensis TaxID=1903276 RepID=A0A2H1FHL8_9ARCH|nr:protein of unknown function [Candidatus Nitrosotalea okcheonensis]